MNFHAYFNPSKKTKKDERETLQISKKKSKQKVNLSQSGTKFQNKKSNFEIFKKLNHNLVKITLNCFEWIGFWTFYNRNNLDEKM